MTIRPYRPTDADDLLAVFRKNVPVAFAENEIADYAGFLQTNADPYFVAEHNEQVVGACGWYETRNGEAARICWIFADPDTKGLGVGGALLLHNLTLIRQHSGIQLVESQTSQVAYRFFEKFGFQVQYTKPDVWAPGLDLYFMTLPTKRIAEQLSV
ncbi:GNAT family N-acetyltransferase [Spirosoma areae]